MNIHSEYCFLPEGAVLPDESIKVLGIHSEGFYFLIHHGSEILYALLGSFRNGITASALMAITDRKPTFKMSELDQLLLVPESFVAVPNEFLAIQNDRQLYEMVNVIPDSYELIKSNLSNTGATLLSAFNSESFQVLQQLQPKQPLADLTAAWFNKIDVSASENSAHMLIFPSSFVIAVFVNGKLQLINSFNYSDKSNFLYYSLGAIKACKINPADIELWLCGEISPSSPLAEALTAYFPAIRYDAVENNGDADSRRLSSMLFPLFQ
ncbi:MAG: hypothetical protein A2W93_02970 [Bacteroidetes bacterium GWF2_43_63]|nr:MAG: hypothetical protein A2W94_08970 [Bacteroidetes bacterium GWE2_42_42]OFY53627.1 MAG: hypothetical protein A2W93_02970 [Bacteroidetes bacterium GWF2_43_63]HBG71035.1 hypothetical protein [Bacteroidales bacterium]HCB63613.1 hypothetical protein [Bacteroidales bacterium]HCY24362.1 hypothetical protein [Bacteroidales bacterium]